MQRIIIDLTMQALDKYSIEKDIAAYVKKEVSNQRFQRFQRFQHTLQPLTQLDQRFGVTWHCIVGRSFGSYVTHETKHFIYFYVGQIAILVFKTS